MEQRPLIVQPINLSQGHKLHCLHTIRVLQSLVGASKAFTYFYFLKSHFSEKCYALSYLLGRFDSKLCQPLFIHLNRQLNRHPEGMGSYGLVIVIPVLSGGIGNLVGPVI